MTGSSPFSCETLQQLRAWLEQCQYACAAAMPGFRTRAVYPLQDLWVARRARTDRPVPLAAHSRPRQPPVTVPEAALRLHRLFYAHEQVALEVPPSLLEEGIVRRAEAGLEARYQLTPLPGPLYLFSSIPGRTPGEFVYLGDDSGLLLEAARALPLPNPACALDLCCGCGVVGLSLPACCQRVLALDLNADAVALAQANAVLNQQPRLEARVGNLYEGLEETFDLVVGNPPALPFMPREANFRFADGGERPTHLTVEAVRGLERVLKPEGQALFLTFSLDDQLWEDLRGLLDDRFSLTYRVRESFAIRGGRLDHVWVYIRRDGRGVRRRRGPTWWERAVRFSWPLGRLGLDPQREKLSRFVLCRPDDEQRAGRPGASGP